MLTISNDSLKVFELNQSDVFYAKTMSFLKENAPEALVMSDEALKGHILKCKTVMQEKNLFSEQAIVLWSVLSLVDEGKITKHESVKTILDNVNEPQEKRLEAIVRYSGK